ncbi:CAP domain-containing protein, partial [Streptomyces shenzhenensis]
MKTAPVGGTTLDPGLSDNKPAADYTAESPSPPTPPSPSPSRTSAAPSTSAPAAGGSAKPKSEPSKESKASS